MKISLEEARKRATTGPLLLRGAEDKQTSVDITLFGHTPQYANPRYVARVYGQGVFSSLCDERDANAALLAHCWNRFDEVVAALEDLAFDAARVERKFSEGRDWTEWRDLRDKLASAKDLLAKAKTVEMP